MNLVSQLDQLETAQLVRRADEPDVAYLFKHALTRESAHESLLRKDRREIHRCVAEAMESIYADRLEEFAPILAQHYAEAGDDAKTLAYATRAGDASARIYANAEAVAHYSIAIDAAKRALSPVERGRAGVGVLQNLYLNRGRALELASRFPAALANYAEMEQLARESGDRAFELSALIAQCQVRCTPTS